MTKSVELRPILPLPKILLNHHLENLSPILNQWTEPSKIPPVMLLTGVTGIGKRSVVHYLAQGLLCENSKFSDPCGACSNCQRALKNTWIDFTEISSETSSITSGEEAPEEKKSRTLKIEQFRNLKETLGFGAYQSTFRVIHIHNAEQMTPQAANSLLKFLEEPPKGWVLFLTASDPTLLLPTLVSRCQMLRLKPLSTALLEKILEENNLSVERIPIAARLAQGSWKKALTLCSNASWESRQNLFYFLKNPSQQLVPFLESCAKDPKNFEFVLDCLEQVLDDLIGFSIKKDSCKNLDQREILLELAEKIKFDPIRYHARICKARAEAQTPVNRKILIQDLLFPWLDSK